MTISKRSYEERIADNTARINALKMENRRIIATHNAQIKKERNHRLIVSAATIEKELELELNSETVKKIIEVFSWWRKLKEQQKPNASN